MYVAYHQKLNDEVNFVADLNNAHVWGHKLKDGSCFFHRAALPLGSTRQETQQTDREELQKAPAHSQELQRYFSLCNYECGGHVIKVLI